MWPHSNVTHRYKNVCTNSHDSGTNTEYDFILFIKKKVSINMAHIFLRVNLYSQNSAQEEQSAWQTIGDSVLDVW
jgi:hypothetical protein